MYKKESNSIIKHIDFVILDMLSLQISFILSYFIFRGIQSPYRQDIYRLMAIVIELIVLLVIFVNDTFKNVLKRSNLNEFKRTIQHAVYVAAISISFLYFLKAGVQEYSRLIVVWTFIIYIVLSYTVRILWKQRLNTRKEGEGAGKLLIVTHSSIAEKVVKNLKENNYSNYEFAGLVILDQDLTGTEIAGIPVVSSEADTAMYVCKQWIDEVLIIPLLRKPYPSELVNQLSETGVTYHINLAKINNEPGRKQFVEKIGDYTVLTTSMNSISPIQMFLKRLLDIVGGIVGCVFTMLLTIIIGPIIYINSPGPIFFSQTRIGKNGKPFKIYKFRSMYLDAEERKADLMAENKLNDNKMFKMDFDPRVIGNKILPDGTYKMGIGQFIRDTSLDEFPQFFNVLKGEMSLVGTRPPLTSEVENYSIRHRARLATKPGITGMWQVSGRSDITDFEEVVNLDRKYINDSNFPHQKVC